MNREADVGGICAHFDTATVFATRLGENFGTLFVKILMLGILGPSFDTHCRPPRYLAGRHCAFLSQPLSNDAAEWFSWRTQSPEFWLMRLLRQEA